MNKNHIIKNKIIKLFIICFIIGYILAFLFYYSLDKIELKSLISAVKNSNILFKTSNNIINHLKILSVTVLLTLIFVGVPIFIGLIISEGFKICLRLIILFKIYKLKGIIYGLIYTLINNGIYLLILIFIFKKIIKIAKALYLYKIKKENINFNYLFNNYIRIITLIIFTLIFDTLIYLYGNYLLNYIIKLCQL